MLKHEGCERGFHWLSRAWYAKACMYEHESIMLGMYDAEGGSSGEMEMSWESIGCRLKDVPRLHVFDDAWSALALFKDLIDELAKVDNQNITAEQFVEILKKCGFKDLTAYTEADQ